MKIIERTTAEIIDTDYKEFALYTLESRAIPSAIDGLKPVQRKILYGMSITGGKKTKISDVGAISQYNYDHGEASAMTAAVALTAPWNNNEPLFIGHGSFGTRLVPQAASPRYIYAELSPAFKKYFIDEQVAPKHHNEDNPEPAHYLPIIPWALVNGISGIAVGFKTDILPRSIKDVAKATKECLANPKKYLEENKPILPTFPGFRGKVETEVGGDRYFTKGIVEYIGKYSYKISELPIGYDRESYVEHLENMIEKDLIKDYSDDCSKSGFGFTIKVSVSQKTAADKDPIKYFSLMKSHSEILTTIGYDSKIKIFQSVAELVHYFVLYRLSKFEDKKEFDLFHLNERIDFLQGKREFLCSVIDGKLNVSKSTKNDMLDYIAKNITKNDEWAKKYVSTPVYAMTKDENQLLLNEINDLKQTKTELENKTSLEIFHSVL